MAVRDYIYVSGAMTGVEDFNYPAFDAAARWLTDHGWHPVSPADLDRKAGFTTREAAMRRDLIALTGCTSIAMLPGWGHSPGARLERAAAEAMGLDVYFLDVDSDHFEEVGATGMAPGLSGAASTVDAVSPRTAPTTILDEAKTLITGARQEAYGPPIQDFSRTAQIVSALLGIEIRPEQIPLIMIAVKLSREIHRPKKDNMRDLCGYAGTYEMVRNEVGGW